VLGLILLAGLGLRLYLLVYKLLGIGSDEAVIGLMARHILQGERPFFYYGQSYYGPLDAYLTSLLFAVFPPNDFVLRIVPLTASLLFVVVIFHLGKALYSREVGYWSAAYAAIAPAFLLVRGLKGDAAYSLVLLIGALALLCFHGLTQRFSCWRLAGLIGLCLLGLWVFPLMLYTIGAIVLTWLITRLAARGQPNPALRSPSGRWLWLGIAAAGTAALVWLGRDLRVVQNVLSGGGLFLSNALPILLGIFPPVEYYPNFTRLIESYPPLLVDLAVALSVFLLGLGLAAGVSRFQQGDQLLFVFFTLTLLAFVLFFSLVQITPYIFSFPRYLFPLYATIPLWVDAFMRWTGERRALGVLGGVLVIGLNLYSNLVVPPIVPPAPDLLAWADRQAETQYVYIDYWNGYWLAFETQEQVIPSVLAGIQAGSNRYAPYAERVRSARRPVYILPAGSLEAGGLRALLSERGIEYLVERAGDFEVFHDLSTPLIIGQ